MRIFRRGDTLGFACQIFNGRSARAEARIVHDGKQVMAGPIEPQGNADGTGTAKGAIALATLAPGNYILQIVLMSGQAKDTVASQWIDFEIVP
jgi:hypothetical protein